MFRGCVSQAALARTAACSLRRSTLRTTSRIRTPTAIPFSSTASASQLYRNNGPAEPEPHVPLSLQALYFKPLRREETHGLPVCNLQLRSFSVRQLEAQADFALRAAYYLNLPAGIATLPKKIERWTVPRSNFVHKKSQENFERITRSRVIQIKDGHPETVELWLAFIKKHAYYGVGLKANLWSFDEIGIGKTMNVSLDTLRDVSRPKWAHFGPGKTVETAAMVREILRGDRYKEKPFPLTITTAAN
ncbi:ribosomal protein S10 domain-containing protein [Peziza echinospora]|nr:ribosomal protein S10 domain-containing protein [Peziza echinospora]